MLAHFGMQAGNIIGIGSYTPTYAKPDPKTGQSADVTPFWMVGGTGAEIEVDTETGRIRVTKLINAGDVGCAINPEIVKRQLNGAAMMQLGFTLFEEMLFDGGQVINASLADYKIPGFLDIPDEIIAEFIEVPHQRGPFGAKGMGETGTFGVSPAIANALYDAVGVRILGVAAYSRERYCARFVKPRTAPWETNENERYATTHDPLYLESAQGDRQYCGTRESGRDAAARLQSFRGARELRAGTLRLLHRAGEWTRGIRLPLPGRACRWRRGSDDRGTYRGGKLHPIQQAFIAKAGFQCGFCTPGMILMTKELLDANPNPTEEQIRHHLSGNLCRCAAYPEIVQAVKEGAMADDR